jgi:hypothetical protein
MDFLPSVPSPKIIVRCYSNHLHGLRFHLTNGFSFHELHLPHIVWRYYAIR